MIDLGERAFMNRLAALIYSEARILIDLHKEKGHEVVLMTSATRYQAEPIAQALGVDNMCCTELEIVAGRITGNATPCHGETKKAAAQRYAGNRSTELTDAFFYSDSCDDLPLLEAVGRPVAVNAKASLAKIAEARGWPQLAFVTQGELPLIAT
jgi:putative phosphoserine phosphatase/1-acylglycerol-3-phosphate O-acyltransferase